MKPYVFSGTFSLTNETADMIVGVSGNAKQRRLYVRRWKKMGFAVKPFNQRGYNRKEQA